MKDFLKKHWILVISLIYVVFPLDFISEIFGPIGLIDDFSILTAAFLREFIIYRKAKKSLENKKNVI